MSLADIVPSRHVQPLHYNKWTQDVFHDKECWNTPLGEVWFCVQEFAYDEAENFYKGQLDRDGCLNVCRIDN